MKSGMTSVDCLALARELAALEGAWFDKAFQPARDEVVVRLRVAGQGAREWRVKAGKWAYASAGPKDWPESLTPYAQTLRTHLEGARFAGARQVGFDRILELDFAKPAGRYVVACELFGEGNVVLVREGKVIAPLRTLRVAHRTVAPGEAYVHPPAGLDPRAAEPSELHARLMGSKADVVRTVATQWNLGGQYAEEVVLRTGLDKKLKAAKLEPAQRDTLAQALQGLLAEVLERPEPGLVRDGALVVDATPIQLRTHAELSFEARGAFSQALEDYFTAYAKEHLQIEDPRVAAAREEVERLRRQAEAQEASLAEFDAEVAAQRALGDLLYARFQEVEAVLAEARERRARGGWQALQDWAKEPAQGPFRVVRADGAEGLLVVELDGRELALLVDGSVHASAERAYARAKLHREKAEGARAALVETRAKLADAEHAGEAALEKLARERAKRRFEPTKKLWFETYRWFLSSEGCLVLAGRDAGSNDKVVKKHLEPNDRYVHADQPGAPSVVIKRGALPDVGEATLREAAEFAVAYSKAWVRRIGSADAYWVTPEQVSKTPQAGEYLGRGAFIIRGKRNFLSVPLRAAVGEVEVEGHRKIMGGPVQAVQARAQRWVVIEPGTENANDLAKRLTEAFQVPLEEVQAVLPPGPVRVVEERLG
ncbi:MAG TPA: ribosome rescue protein RqcH [Candidatus Thermoplasmatota archaeon]|jgi:predicted ribosome quality control (RQC) complex YloA/Tae2 family protein|nr:ribosome rescue protein RqcH [Candidatus Thermoplasmatota archaeon]